MYVVYGLEDQRDHEVFYVGVTTDVYERFLQHLRYEDRNLLKDARIKEMRAEGYLPLMRTLQLAPNRTMAGIRESYWIRHYYDMGMRLTNQVIPIKPAQEVELPKPHESRKHVTRIGHLIRSTIVTPDPRYLLTDEEVSRFTAGYFQHGSMEQALRDIGHGARYKAHARQIIADYGLKER